MSRPITLNASTFHFRFYYFIPEAMTHSSLPVSAIDALEQSLHREMELLCLPPPSWVHQREADGVAVIDVLIIGAGMCGLAAGAALRLQGIDNVQLIDRAPDGREGPWVTYARMETLRSPKALTGPALGLPSLTFRAWHVALFGQDAWASLNKIPRALWMQYLQWYRKVMQLTVANDTQMKDLVLRADGMLDVVLEGPQGRVQITARKLVLANGRDGLGGPYLPPIATLIDARYRAHTSEMIDFDALRGKRVAVIGAGASAMDNAATALESGAASVDMFVRRNDIPRINKLTGISNPGLVHGFVELADDWKWRIQAYSIATHPPPPRDSTLRVSCHANARFHVGSPLLALQEAPTGIVITTPKGRYEIDYLIFATGFCQDLSLRPELASIAPLIRLWQHRYDAPAESSLDELLLAPDLGALFEFQPRPALPADIADKPEIVALSSIHCFNYAAMLSHGKVSGDIPAVSTGAQRLATGLAASFFQEDIALHYRDLEAYDKPELLGDEWRDADLDDDA